MDGPLIKEFFCGFLKLTLFLENYCVNLLLHAVVEHVDRLEAEDGEDDRAGVQRREQVGAADHHHVPLTVLLRVVVRTKAK